MTKKLYRSKRNRMISGVSGGLAKYFDLDPVLIRALFIITTIAWGTGLLAYIILWIITPEEKLSVDSIRAEEEEHGIENTAATSGRTKALGILLIALGLLILIAQIVPDIRFEYLWPVVLIIVGAIIILRPLLSGKGGAHESK